MITLVFLISLVAVPQQQLLNSDLNPEWKPLQTPDLSTFEPAVAEQLAKAQDELRDLLVASDADQCAEAYGNLAEIYHAYALLDPAEVCYRNALLINPKRGSSLYLLARLELDRGQPEAAASLLTSFAAIHPDYAPAWYQLGEIALAEVKLDQAEAAYQRAAELVPEAAAPRSGLGQVALGREQWQKAIDYFEAALKLQARADRLYYFLGTAYRNLGQESKAREMLQRAGKIGPAMPDPLFGRLASTLSSERLFISKGKTAFNAGDLNGAIALFEQALVANPSSLGAAVNLGATLARKGDKARAIEHFRLALGIDPQSPIALFNLGILLSTEPDHRPAYRYLERLLSIKEDPEGRLTLANLYLQDRRFEEALRHYQALAESVPDLESALVQRARILIELARYEEAASALANDHARHPDYGSLVHLYARFLATCPVRDLRNGAQATTLAQQVVDALPNSTHLETLALAFGESGQCDKAAEAQQRAIFAARAENINPPRLAEDLARYQRGSGCRPGDR